MDGTGGEDDRDGHCHECSMANEKNEASPASSAAEEPGSPSDKEILDAPIQFLVYFHEAMREELEDLLRVAITSLESCDGSRISCDLTAELRRRLEFLRLVYKYHCAAEDEVIFLAMDVHVKNVIRTYSLEHISIDDLFDTVFDHLNALMEENKNSLLSFQEIVICISTLQSFMCQHMLKEEEQVFPLLLKQFSTKEQASLVWQLICSIPVILIKELLPWIVSYLSPGEQVHFTHCIIEIVPKEEFLQEVVKSWLRGNDQSSSGDCSMLTQVDACGADNMKSSLQSYREPARDNLRGKKPCHVHLKDGFNLIDYLRLWHGAIKKDLKISLEDLYRIKTSNSNLESTVVQLKFLADVITFYSNALKKFFYPVLDELPNKHLSASFDEKSYIEHRIQSLQRLLYCEVENHLPSCEFGERLCQELECFLMDISKQFHFQEAEVFPFIRESCSIESQKQLLFMCLHVMPLGLLKCVVTWFAAHVAKLDFRSIPQTIDTEDLMAYGSFASLLLQWFHVGYSGEISAENFGKALQKIFSSRISFVPEQITETVGRYSSKIKMQGCKDNSLDMAPISSDKGKKVLSYLSSSDSNKAWSYEASYSADVNLHVLFPGLGRVLRSFSELPGEENCATSSSNEPMPIDLLFLFHKGIKKDMEQLVSITSQLAENFELVTEIHKHFNLLLCRYKFHSDGEDEVAFAALELKGKVKNISHSYTIDHKLEVKLFSEFSLILDEVSKFRSSVSSLSSSWLESEMIKTKLCRKLYRKCKSIHRIIFDHVQHEEVELWPLFRECFSIKEQERIIGQILGRVAARTLQDLIPWLVGHITPEEQLTMMLLWRKITKNTKFDEWLAEWWEAYDAAHTSEEERISAEDPLEIVSSCLSKEAPEKPNDMGCSIGNKFSNKDWLGANVEILGKYSLDNKEKVIKGYQSNPKFSELQNFLSKGGDEACNQVAGISDDMEKPSKCCQSNQDSIHHDYLLKKSHNDPESATRKVSNQSSKVPQQKSHLNENQHVSHLILQKQEPQMEAALLVNGNEIPGQRPSYRDPLSGTLGCKHYRRNCKLVTACCNQLYTCIRCHDEMADHSTDRKAIEKMMCMKCLVIQPIGQTCSTASCINLSMAKYYCRICKLFDDEREIYHCPYCNLCRLGKGLGVDYFHCMNCNACMSRSLSVHVCREKSFEDNCPICHEDMFTSITPVKALPCGHLMHSTCFQEYTCTHYICPICSKSLGDMQVYFKMLDALLSEEKIPDEYSHQTQAILCNDCEKKGTAPFHWLYHKCRYCGSYNTRLL